MSQATVVHADIPRPVLIGAGALAGFAMLVAGVARQTDIGATRMPERAPVEARALNFADGSDGSVRVVDATSRSEIGAVAPGTGGFVRGTLRGLARERAREGASAAAPFRLVRWNDGTLTLIDDTTGRRVELDAFGPANAGAFAAYLTATGDAK